MIYMIFYDATHIILSIKLTRMFRREKKNENIVFDTNNYNSDKTFVQIGNS
jgi:hypothetical protein